MLRALTAVIVLTLAPSLAAADGPAKTGAAPAASPCKRIVVGRGLDRHITCEIAAPIIIKGSPPKPNVLVVQTSPRDMIGRPRSSDRLVGLSHELTVK